MHRRLFLSLLITAGLPALTSAGFSAPQDAARTAHVRIIHAAPDAPAMDVLLDGKKALENVPFKKVSDYLPVPAGMHAFKVVVTGSNNAVIDTNVTFRPGMDYTALAIGKAADMSIRPLLLEDITPSASKTNALVRVVYVLPDGPPVDLVIPSTTGGAPTTLVKNFETGKATEYLSAPAGDYTVEVHQTGMTNVLKKIDVTVKGGTVYSMVAFGLASDPGNIDVVPLTDTTTTRNTPARPNRPRRPNTTPPTTNSAATASQSNPSK